MNLAQYQRSTGWLGADLRYVARTASTNTLLLDAGARGAREGTVVVADEQTAGRGRLRRQWHAPAGVCLLLSLLLRPPVEAFAAYATRAMQVCGLALAESVSLVSGIPVWLKWPNDLIVQRASGDWYKVAGMLSEVGLDTRRQPGFLVIGIGLNVNVSPDDLPQLTPGTTFHVQADTLPVKGLLASSLLAECGHPVDRARLLDRFLSEAESLYTQVQAGWDPLSRWASRLAWLGQEVQVLTPTATLYGVAEGVETGGALRLRLADGTRQCFQAGDVSLRNL
ncbi:MAG: biotin--[acetyl-CoA-carboxylase] ligase [Anaerolineae bacterium]|nr:biotin--[acetyl-CoA-carboxylase] ligase [Anaerolineae bacterium]